MAKKFPLFISLFLGCFVLLSSSRSGATTFDGCYELKSQNFSTYIACLRGTEEEGVNGPNAKLVLINPKTNHFVTCFYSTNLDFTSDSLKVSDISGRVIHLEDIKTEMNGLKSGKAFLINLKNTFTFVELDPKSSQEFKKIASNFCL